MSLRVRRADGGTDRWDATSDERTWFDYTHQVVDGELVLFLHTFRRVRERADRTHDALLWKHHTTKVARRYAAGAWTRVTHVKARRPPVGVERVTRTPRAPRERARRGR